MTDTTGTNTTGTNTTGTNTTGTGAAATDVHIGDHFQPTRVSQRVTAVVLNVSADTVKFEYRREDGRLNDTNDHVLPRDEFLATFRKIESAAGG